MRNTVRYSVIFVFIITARMTGQTQSKPAKLVTSSSKALVCGPVSDSSLKCPRFGFSYKIPFGWVDRTDDMRKEDTDDPAQGAKPETLLATFERPPGAPGETVNSAVVIAAEPLKTYPQIKTASDYFGPITDLAEQRGLKAESEPYQFAIGAKQLVRGDFSRASGEVNTRQSSLAMIEKGYIVSFTFVAGTDEEIDELLANLSFMGPKQPSRPAK